jgi:hypothetical protein
MKPRLILLAVACAAATAQAQERASTPFDIAKETTAVLQPLRADGIPDHVAAINAKYGQGVTRANNDYIAWFEANFLLLIAFKTIRYFMNYTYR